MESGTYQRPPLSKTLDNGASSRCHPRWKTREWTLVRTRSRSAIRGEENRAEKRGAAAERWRPKI